HRRLFGGIRRPAREALRPGRQSLRRRLAEHAAAIAAVREPGRERAPAERRGHQDRDRLLGPSADGAVSRRRTAGQGHCRRLESRRRPEQSRRVPDRTRADAKPGRKLTPAIMAASWLLYGATGYTGELIAREAVKRGMKPVLAGRSRDKILKLAAELDCP